MSKVTMPKPVGYFACDPKTLNPEWGEECVCQDDIYCPDDTGTVGRAFIFMDQAEAYAAAKVREALEEAAKVCDDRANQNELATSGVEPDEVSSLRSAAWQMGVCARAIRALIPSTPA